ncbi:MAG: toxin [Desulfamplus sp.]|nr:toxin [Desulfamplus sp.]
MNYFNWNNQKNQILKRERAISFEEVVLLIQSGQIIDVLENPVKPNQKLYILSIDDYAYVVPFVENDEEIFLKTIFPSRKFTKLYKLKGEGKR